MLILNMLLMLLTLIQFCFTAQQRSNVKTAQMSKEVGPVHHGKKMALPGKMLM